jgi:23S rRNA (uracil1939-C5)-methyltransferase
VLARVLAYRPENVIDGYSGSGELALALAETGVRVAAIELDSDASSHASVRLPEGSRAISAKVEEVLSSLLPADVVVLNPPRTGVDGRVTELLEQASPTPRAIIYVSCNPATLARDLARLPHYRIESLRAFDMFPQTAHVETVCELVPLSA